MFEFLMRIIASMDLVPGNIIQQENIELDHVQQENIELQKKKY